MAMNLGLVTQDAKKKNALPWPTQPYAGAAPITTPGLTVAPTPTPSTVQDALKNTNATVDQAKGSVAATQPFLDNYLKPNAAGTTPFRQALTNTKASTTADAYDNAVSATRNKAVAMGFASNPQPVTFGAEAGLANERAKAIADIPNKVNIEAQPVEAQAAQMQQQQAGIYNALANTQQGETGILAQQKAQSDAQKAALAGGLAQTGLSVGVPLVKSLFDKAPSTVAQGLAKTVAAPTVGSIIGGSAGAATPSLAAITAGTVPELPTSAIGLGAAAAHGGAAAGAAAAPLTGYAGGGLVTSHGALIGMATNPITIGVAAAIVGVAALLKSQAHWEANDFVQHFQNPFDSHMHELETNFEQASRSGQMTKEHAAIVLQEATAATEEYKRKLNEFSQQGADKNKVAHQAKATAEQWYGPNFTNFLGNLQQVAAGIA